MLTDSDTEQLSDSVGQPDDSDSESVMSPRGDESITASVHGSRRSPS